MPKVSEEFTNARREEIIRACAELYKTRSFKEISIKDIALATSFTRTSIYNYFNTKEEIFLALMQREYELWTADLEALTAEFAELSKAALAKALAHVLEKRERLLRLLAMNHFDMEENSHLENLTEFKRAYGNALKAVRHCLDKFCPEMTEEGKTGFLYAYFPFLFGIYPYTTVTEKQRTAMEAAGVDFVYHSVYDLACSCTEKLLRAYSESPTRGEQDGSA